MILPREAASLASSFYHNFSILKRRYFSSLCSGGVLVKKLFGILMVLVVLGLVGHALSHTGPSSGQARDIVSARYTYSYTFPTRTASPLRTLLPKSATPAPAKTPIRYTARPQASPSPATSSVPSSPPRVVAVVTAVPRGPAPTPLMANGSRGEDVAEVQRMLIALGFLNDDADGIYGKLTAQAVKDFQTSVSVPATGEVDAGTYAALRINAAAVIAASPTPVIRVAATPRPTLPPSARATTYRSTVSKTATYILNTNTHKFHKPSCSDVKRIKPGNYKEYQGTRDQVIGMGYSPCKHCYP